MAVQVDGLPQCGPRQQGALDARGIALDSLQRVELVLQAGAGAGWRSPICWVKRCTAPSASASVWPLISSVIIDADA